MLTGRTLRRINNRPSKVNRLPLLAIGGGAAALAALLYALLALPVLALAALLVGALLLFLVYRTEKAKTITSLS
jgi:Flp pilus assembly protein TadB